MVDCDDPASATTVWIFRSASGLFAASSGCELARGEVVFAAGSIWIPLVGTTIIRGVFSFTYNTKPLDKPTWFWDYYQASRSHFLADFEQDFPVYRRENGGIQRPQNARFRIVASAICRDLFPVLFF
jgi:hypothetical protein